MFKYSGTMLIPVNVNDKSFELILQLLLPYLIILLNNIGILHFDIFTFITLRLLFLFADECNIISQVSIISIIDIHASCASITSLSVNVRSSTIVHKFIIYIIGALIS